MSEIITCAPRGLAENLTGRSRLENAAQSPGATGVPATSVFDFVGQKADEVRGVGAYFYYMTGTKTRKTPRTGFSAVSAGARG